MILHFLVTFFLLNLFIFSPSAQSADAATPSSSSSVKKTDPKGGKTQAYSGDPALKRGFELGYDNGMKAGKQDKKEGRKANPTGHPDFSSGDKRFRTEYGNRGKFVAGYQGGFSKGYKAAYAQEKIDKEAVQKAKERDKLETGKKTETNKKTPLPPEPATPEEKKQKADEERRQKSETKPHSGSKPMTETGPSTHPTKPKPKKVNPAEDAL